MQRIIQVLPGAPPMLNGVGDFAFAVARALRSHCQVESRFVVCNPAWSGRPQTDGFDTLAVSRRDADQLASKLEGLCDRGSAPVVLLQLSPYGFDPNGAPRWLARGLEAWKARAPDRRLVTYFHEIYATGWPWQRAFWLSPLQRHICARLARLSDWILTNRAESAGWLSGHAPRLASRIDVLPVVSSIGEPAAPRRPREASMVVWGSGAAKTRIYGEHRDALERAVRACEIRSVVDIGTHAPNRPAAICGAHVTALGVAAPSMLGEALSRARLGMFRYPPRFLGKSSIFAAFCAHGLPALPLWSANDADPRDGLQAGVHYIECDHDRAPDAERLEQIAHRAAQWYSGHDSRAHADRIDFVLERLAAMSQP